jgi:hypothetical protein
VFGQRKRYWVIVTLKDGEKIAGRYDTKSFASSTPSPEQIYLEEAWNLNVDGGFERRREESAGILVISSEIRSVEFFILDTGDIDANRTEETAPSPSDKGVATKPPAVAAQTTS